MQNKLSSCLNEVKLSSEDLKNKSSELEEIVNNFVKSGHEINDSIESISAEVQTSSSTLEEISSSFEGIDSSVVQRFKL